MKKENAIRLIKAMTIFEQEAGEILRDASLTMDEEEFAAFRVTFTDILVQNGDRILYPLLDIYPELNHGLPSRPKLIREWGPLRVKKNPE